MSKLIKKGTTMQRGSCLCGAVHFEISAPLHAPDACHCQQCRKQSGHFWVSTDVARAHLQIHGEEHISWFQSSAKVRRGFCARCGSSLFWEASQRDKIAVAMGAIDTTTDVKIALHIFVAEKGDYYELDDGVPQNLH
jgi:hypothetical protein